jgi:hypothetical protein
VRKTAAQRFWEKVDKKGPVHPILGKLCWIWTAGRNSGYGQFRIGGRHVLAQRLAWEWATGEAAAIAKRLGVGDWRGRRHREASRAVHPHNDVDRLARPHQLALFDLGAAS